MQWETLLIPLLLIPLVAATSSAGESNPLPDPTVDFSKPESGENLPGGTATSLKQVSKDSFSHPSKNMPAKRMFDFKIGKAVFRQRWAPAPAIDGSPDGLGPLFNARSCNQCHVRDGRGRPPLAGPSQDKAASLVLHLSVPPQTNEQKELLARRHINAVPDPTYGYQLQDQAIRGHVAEGKIKTTYEEHTVRLKDGTIVSLRKPVYSLNKLGYGPLHPQIRMSARIAPPLIGLGLLEAINAENILALADPDDDNGDGISGRVNEVWSIEKSKVVLGRFGWKAGQPSISQQNASAFAGDIGISSALRPKPYGDCTPPQTQCLAAANALSRAGHTEVSKTLFDLIDFYARNLAVPARRNIADKKILSGKLLFYKSGCAKCHYPKFNTGKNPQDTTHSDQLIWPYSDMLLHDLGPGLADNRPEGVANGREWRTSPLWGIGLTKTVSGHTFYLHDGRARNLLEAILWHGGEARSARETVVEMSTLDRDALISFLLSL